MKKLKIFESDETIVIHSSVAELAIYYLENSKNKNMIRNYQWIIDDIRKKINSTSNADIQLNKQEYDFVMMYSEKAQKAYSGLDTD